MPNNSCGHCGVLMPLVALTVAACAGGAAEEPLTCNPGAAWTPGTSAFREVTTEWGLEGVVGLMLGVTDLDGDGFADLFVRNGSGPDEFGAPADRTRFVLRNTGTGAFEDVTESSGLLVGRVESDPAIARPGQVFVTGDVDNDGDLDVFVGQTRLDNLDADAETSELMLNNGDGTFGLGPEDSAARMADEVSNPAGASFVDFDRDGKLDLWVVHNERAGQNALPDFLLRGDGQGGFTDVTAERGLTTVPWNYVVGTDLNEGRAHSWGWSAAACDLNNDGVSELLASSYGRAPNHLWRGASAGGQVEFVNESVASGYAYDHRMDWTTDLNAQCYCADFPSEEDCGTCPEPADYAMCEMLAAAFGPSYRWWHDHGREPIMLGGNSGSTICADVDNDGWIDLLTNEIVHFDVGPSSDPTELLFNLGAADVRFERPGNEQTGLVRIDDSAYWNHGDMTGAVLDFDNDGWQDLYIGASDYAGNWGLLFHQRAPREFELVDPADYFLHYRSYGIAVADFDRDGDLDVVVGHSLMRCDGPGAQECGETAQVRMFENQLGAESNWIQLALEGGPGSNRMAIGARVEVTAGAVTQTQQVDGGHGRLTMQRDSVLHFGLGPECRATVVVRWPDATGTEQTFEVEANRRYRVVQGKEPVDVL